MEEKTHDRMEILSNGQRVLILPPRRSERARRPAAAREHAPSSRKRTRTSRKHAAEDAQHHAELLSDWKQFLLTRRQAHISSAITLSHTSHTQWAVGMLVQNHAGELWCVRGLPDSNKATVERVITATEITDMEELMPPPLDLHKVQRYSQAFLYSKRTGYLQRAPMDGEALLQDPRKRK